MSVPVIALTTHKFPMEKKQSREATASSLRGPPEEALETPAPGKRVRFPDHLECFFEWSKNSVNSKHYKRIAKLLSKYQDIFSKGDSDIGRTIGCDIRSIPVVPDH